MNSQTYIIRMVSSKYFAINDGPNAGIYCSYCGEKITPKKNEDDGAFYYQCDCTDARAEIVLLEQQAQLEQKLQKFYSQREKMVKRTQLSKHYSNMELQLKEMKEQLEALGNDSLKMEQPKLPNFNQGTL